MFFSIIQDIPCASNDLKPALTAVNPFYTFSPRLAFAPLAAQDAFALRALRRMLIYVRQHSPFYQSQSIPSEINSLDELQALPFTTKEDMQARNMDFLCVPQRAIREYTATSGTMGRPVTVALTEWDLQRLAYNEAQSFRCADGFEGDIYQLALTLDRQFMAGAAYYSGLRLMGAAAVRSGPGLPAMQWEVAERLQATGIVAVPSFLVAMAEWAAVNGLDPAKTSIRKAVCIGEPLRGPDFSLNALGARLARWPIRLYGTYAATELQTAFTECSAGMGGHHQPDLVIVEIIGEDGTPLPNGEAGEVVVTTLGVEGMPLLRYKTGDVAALHTEVCSCGRKSRRLGPVRGRLGQMIKYRGTTLYPSAITDVLSSVPFITSGVVEAYTGELGLDEIRLHVHSTLEPEACEAALKPLLQSKLRVAPAMQFHSRESLAALQMPAGARKALRFIDRRGLRGEGSLR